MRVEQEAVELGFGQRVGAFLLDGVLRGQHEERHGQHEGLFADRDVPLLHGFEQRGLRFGRRAVDFVGQHHVREQRPFDEAKRPLAGRVVFLQHVGARDVGGHQVGRELDALEAQVEHARKRADEQRLGQARHADQQHVAAAEDGDQHLFDHLLLADDDARDLGHHFLIRGPAGL